MAKSQQERTKDTEARRLEAGEVELRHRVRLGTRELLNDLMEWHGYTQLAEAIQVLILNFHAMGFAAMPPARERPLAGTEPLRHRVRPGVQDKLQEMAGWLGVEDGGQVVEHLITHAHGLGRSGSASLLAVPRHDFHISENVAHLVMAEGIRLADRELRQELKDEWRD
ncbi:hypothetical protein M2318_004885 [Metapseudomonas resinovorans]|uniref:hypothetical protein n=1 Tax=Metapseudomonas resinovorans TaxID=53412 RepID=UPI003D21CA78